MIYSQHLSKSDFPPLLVPLHFNSYPYIVLPFSHLYLECPAEENERFQMIYSQHLSKSDLPPPQSLFILILTPMEFSPVPIYKYHTFSYEVSLLPASLPHKCSIPVTCFFLPFQIHFPYLFPRSSTFFPSLSFKLAFLPPFRFIFPLSFSFHFPFHFPFFSLLLSFSSFL